MKAGIEDAEWKPPRHSRGGHPAAESTQSLRGVKVGETKRIRHPDVHCAFVSKGQGSCSLYQQVKKLRVQGWEIQAYHEADHVLVVRRVR
ncbi:hypothetical protein LCGC14_1892610 [marine sediment metagenome]|uniref:Uncharacterized protein n=1 Tax=marine sediment metagenome TaxID=412755 RepID=A0A0F9IX25_9ZZZZ